MPARSRDETERLRAFALRLKRARIEAGCETMEAGGRRCKTVSSVYQRHETGQLMPTVELILRYATGFGVDPRWLAFGPKGGLVK